MNKVHRKYFDYGNKEISYLCNRDETFRKAVESIGRVERIVIPDLFQGLIYSIAGQQVSVKAANKFFERIERSTDLTAFSIGNLSIDEIQSFGTTFKKAGYIKDIANQVNVGILNLEELKSLSDKDVIDRLCSIKGIGPWTAEMILLNSMERPDILSFGDIAIRRGIMKLYGLSELTKEQFAKYKKLYSPYGSVASIYLWKISFY